LIKPKTDEDNGESQEVWPKSSDEGREGRSGPCRSGSQYKGKHGQATGRRSQNTSDSREPAASAPFEEDFPAVLIVSVFMAALFPPFRKSEKASLGMDTCALKTKT
jgi:hypothetical protein